MKTLPDLDAEPDGFVRTKITYTTTAIRLFAFLLFPFALVHIPIRFDHRIRNPLPRRDGIHRRHLGEATQRR
jgi:hypothetical protein